jgi:NAD(P)-dependent dehydrogenase (short-subunit alcohol dehydrogenase family)
LRPLAAPPSLSGAETEEADMEFDGRHVVVTGGTGALGGAVVRALVEAGARCHVPNLVAAELDAFVFRRHASVSITPGVDVADESVIEAYYTGLPRLWGSIHLAGGFAMAPLGEAGAEAFHAMMNKNALSCYLSCRAAVRNMRAAAAGGRIVNVAARPALEPRHGAGMALYAASKAAVGALTQSLAEELAKENIWVNAVAPSVLDTPANRAAMPKADHSSWAAVDDVARVIVFLASPANRVARGGVIPVYGRA